MADIKQEPGIRYATTEDMRAEFGDYRVNDCTDPLSDSNKPKPEDKVDYAG